MFGSVDVGRFPNTTGAPRCCKVFYGSIPKDVVCGYCYVNMHQISETVYRCPKCKRTHIDE